MIDSFTSASRLKTSPHISASKLLKILKYWMEASKLKLNPSETKLILFRWIEQRNFCQFFFPIDILENKLYPVEILELCLMLVSPFRSIIIRFANNVTISATLHRYIIFFLSQSQLPMFCRKCPVLQPFGNSLYYGITVVYELPGLALPLAILAIWEFGSKMLRFFCPL